MIFYCFPIVTIAISPIPGTLSWSFRPQAVEYFIKKRFDELGLEKYKATAAQGARCHAKIRL